MIKPTADCINYVKKTGTELYRCLDTDGHYYVVFPSARDAVAHGLEVIDLMETYEEGVFSVHAVCQSAISIIPEVVKVI